jgi:hypothetical protein
MGEIVAVVDGGTVRIAYAPRSARIAWGVLAAADPEVLAVNDGRIYLPGGVVYEITGAQQNYAEVTRRDGGFEDHV